MKKRRQHLATLGLGIMLGAGAISLQSNFNHSFVYAQDSILTETPTVTYAGITATPELIATPEAVTAVPEMTATSEAVTAVPELTQTPEVTPAVPEETQSPTSTIEPTEDPAQSVCLFVLDAQGGMIFGINKEDKILLYKKDVKGNTNINVAVITAQRRNYLFKGWYTEPTGGTKVTSLQIKTDTTLYARWKKVTVKKAKISKVQNKKGRKATVKLKKTKGAKGYQVVYSTKRSFKNAKKKNITKRTVTLSKLKKKKTYYVKVRAYKKDSTGKKVFGAYSKVKKVKIRR